MNCHSACFRVVFLRPGSAETGTRKTGRPERGRGPGHRDGSLTAAYYNPRPIRVFREEAGRKDGRITLFVDLRDVNYPGSTYTLHYDPASDRLRGTYFQAVQRQTFDIEFVRSR
jgi:hypothetical protein